MVTVETRLDCSWSAPAGGTALLVVEPERGRGQQVRAADLDVEGAATEAGPLTPVGPDAVRLRAEGGRVTVAATSLVELPVRDLGPRDADQPLPDLDGVALDLLPWTWASRWVPSDLLGAIAHEWFGDQARTSPLPWRVAATVADRLVPPSGGGGGGADATAPVTVTAEEALLRRTGGPREAAHVTVGLLRALGVPARVVAGYAPDVEPPGFVLLPEAHDGQGWLLLDPTRSVDLATVVRVATGADAAAVAWVTTTPGWTLERVTVGARTVTEEP